MEKQKRQWENYVFHAQNNLSEIDAQIYQLLILNSNPLEGSTRREEILRAITHRTYVDQNPAVAELRNKLDDWDNYIQDIQPSTDHMDLRILRGKRMEEDVLALMDRRQRLARGRGFASYPELVLWSKDLDLKVVRLFLLEYIGRNLPIVQKIAKDMGITWKTWYEVNNALEVRKDHLGAGELVGQVLTALGFGHTIPSISILEKDQQIFGYVGVISIPDDIRILVKLINDLGGETVLFHELGHAIAHTLNKTSGIFQTWTSVHVETMAVILEQIAPLILFDEQERKIVQATSIFDDVRCATSALFELELWEHPGDAEQLHRHYYGKWGLGETFSDAWAADSFRSIDPVYIQNYVLAAQIADQTISYLQNQFGLNFLAWGHWLAEYCYKDGRERTLNDKFSVVGYCP